MAKTKVSEWDAVPGNNTDIDSINIAEGCAPSGINNAIRELMSQVKDFQQGTYSDPFNGPVNGTVGAITPAAGAFTTLTASSTATLNTLASSGATLTGGSINNMAIGGSTAAAGAFTTLAASGAVTISGGTANGVAYLNGSKVLTTGSALTFDGTSFNIGNGTNTYTAKLLTNGLAMATDNTTYQYMGLCSSGVAYAGTATNHPYAFAINGSEQMRLTSTGLGIGTSSPAYKLDVAGTVNVVNGSNGRINIGATNNYLYGDSSGNFIVGTSGSDKLQLTSSGNLGLGVTPSAWSNGKAIEVGVLGGALWGYAANETYMLSNAYFNGGWKYAAAASTTATRYSQISGQHIWSYAAAGTAGNAISFTQAMTLTAAGQLLVGRTTYSGTGKLNVEGGADFTGGDVILCRDTGNVGIGTSSPQSKLSIYTTDASSKITLSDSTVGNGYGGVLYGYGVAGTGGYMEVGVLDGSAGYTKGIRVTQQANNIQFFTGTNNAGNAERMRLDSSGNLGLGVTPSAWGTSYKAIQMGYNGIMSANSDDAFYLASNTYYNGTSWIYSSTNNAAYMAANNGAWSWNTAPSGTAGNAISFTQAMTLDASGRLLVGTTSASGSQVDIVDATGYNNRALTIARSSTDAAAKSSAISIRSWTNAEEPVMLIGAGIDDNTSNSVRIGGGFSNLNSATSIAFYTAANNTTLSGTERARIDSSGYLLLGQTTSSGTGGLFLAPSQSAGGALIAWNRSDTTGYTYATQFKNAGTVVGQIYYTNTATSYATSSDYRLKENIQPMTGALAKVAALKPCTYNWKKDGSAGQGFIAHELAEVVPQCVSGTKDAVDADGNPVYQGIDTSFLVATLTAAIQEQQAIINDLKARLDAANL